MQRPAPHFSAPTGPAGYSARPSYQSQFSGSSANQSAQPGKRFIGPDVMFDGKRMRKAVYRKTVDYNTSVVNYLENRIWQRDKRDQRGLQPDLLYCPLVVPPPDLISRPMNCVTSRFIRTSMNKIKCPIFCVCWTPEGRRLITGASSGEFTLWNGLTFNFETILQAHDSSVRAMQWSPNDQWMLTGDHNGFVKYWQSNMNNVKMYQAHKDPIRGLSFCPTNSKFASCSDDGTVRIWDFLRCHEEKILRGHGADVKCVDWHPQKALVVSGSKDTQQPIKLWDPRSGSSLATLHAHKHTVMEVKWNQNGNWLLTASRDHLLKLYDIRQMKEDLQTFKGHKKEATTVCWHPTNESLFCSGGSDGAIMFWLVGHDKEVGCIEEAHEGMVWSLAWHPLGHILASGSNDHSTKFWTRNRPGDRMRDKYNLNTLPMGISDDYDYEMDTSANLPGMGLEYGLPEHLKSKKVPEPEEEDKLMIPGLDFESTSPELDRMIHKKKVPYAKPIPKSFEQAWETGLQPPSVGPMDPNGMQDQMGPNQMHMRGGHQQGMGGRGMRGNMRGMRGPLLQQPRGGGNMYQGNQGNQNSNQGNNGPNGQDGGYGDENGRGFNNSNFGNNDNQQQQQFGGNFNNNRGRGQGGNFGGQQRNNFGDYDGRNKRDWQDDNNDGNWIGGGNDGGQNYGGQNNDNNWSGGGQNKFQRMDNNMGGNQNDNFGGLGRGRGGFRGGRGNRGSPRGGYNRGRGNRGGNRWNRGGGGNRGR